MSLASFFKNLFSHEEEPTQPSSRNAEPFRAEEIFDRIARNSIAITPTPALVAPKPCTSKFGGAPDLPSDFEWPEAEDYPLAFLGQIRCEEIADFDLDHHLPEKGLLSFFYDTVEMPWGDDESESDSFLVKYFPDVSDLIPTELPEDMPEEGQIPVFSLTFSSQKELPAWEECGEELDEIGDFEDYDEAVEAYGCTPFDGEDGAFKLLGYANLVQGSAIEDCESVFRPINWKKASEAEKKAFAEDAENWVLLLQFSTLCNEKENFELMFGDCGNLFFYIRKEDLAARDFSKVWIVLQCG